MPLLSYGWALPYSRTESAAPIWGVPRNDGGGTSDDPGRLLTDSPNPRATLTPRSNLSRSSKHHILDKCRCDVREFDCGYSESSVGDLRGGAHLVVIKHRWHVSTGLRRALAVTAVAVVIVGGVKVTSDTTPGSGFSTIATGAADPTGPTGGSNGPGGMNGQQFQPPSLPPQQSDYQGGINQPPLDQNNGISIYNTGAQGAPQQVPGQQGGQQPEGQQPLHGTQIPDYQTATPYTQGPGKTNPDYQAPQQGNQAQQPQQGQQQPQTHAPTQQPSQAPTQTQQPSRENPSPTSATQPSSTVSTTISTTTTSQNNNAPCDKAVSIDRLTCVLTKANKVKDLTTNKEQIETIFKSPTLRQEWIDHYADFEFRIVPGNSAYTQPSEGYIAVGQNIVQSNNPGSLAETLAHEFGHGQYFYSGRPDGDSTGLVNEAYATLHNITVQREILSNGGQDIGIAGQYAIFGPDGQPVVNPDGTAGYYDVTQLLNQIYDSPKSLDEKMADIAQIFAVHEAPSSCPTINYAQYYKTGCP